MRIARPVETFVSISIKLSEVWCELLSAVIQLECFDTLIRKEGSAKGQKAEFIASVGFYCQ